ncbi:pyridine nucleotide transhydrogenase [Caballeronia sp. LP006]|uniref:pyridine nucleotide transhydrogenase n=1 Tax=Caballeronia sp. LP006 TaxID=3038552 RepID=UPI0028550C83|nr:pyridine nucleotide transhydrogenase [Caballeronia sp. LP006]MDR5831962.1 pyridine nucleotide transhydrogenase [Caballeronia sp. LP006]
MTNALIGYSGFVGQTLLRQGDFGSLYRSTNIGQIDGQTFDDVTCAGTPAQKWIANREPEADARNIEALITHLKKIRCRHFTLISTVDVFGRPIEVDEDSTVDESELHAYGKNRRHLEKFVASHFADHLIVRLPGLVGPGLRKNVIFDFLNDNNVSEIDSRGVFQFYPMVNLSYDIAAARNAGLKLIHLTAEPISVADISEHGFGKSFEQHVGTSVARYDMRTRHALLFGGAGSYQYSARETIQAVRAYAQSEPLNAKDSKGSAS